MTYINIITIANYAMILLATIEYNDSYDNEAKTETIAFIWELLVKICIFTTI